MAVSLKKSQLRKYTSKIHKILWEISKYFEQFQVKVPRVSKALSVMKIKTVAEIMH